MSTPSHPQQPSGYPQYAQPTGAPPHVQPHQYAQPGTPSAPYGQATPGDVPSGRNTPGLISLILGVIGIVWMFAFIFVQAFTLSGGVAGMETVAFVNLTVAVLLGLAGLITGIVGLGGRRPSKGVAGIGTGLAIASLAGAATSLVYPLAYALLG